MAAAVAADGAAGNNEVGRGGEHSNRGWRERKTITASLVVEVKV